jgi:hypothetical protein
MARKKNLGNRLRFPSANLFVVSILLNFEWIASVQFRHQCTSQEAALDGTFECINDCDQNHAYGGTPYCLSYLPAGGDCFMKAYSREQILSCGGKTSGRNHWVVYVGGSNMVSSSYLFISISLTSFLVKSGFCLVIATHQFLELKMMLDFLLELPIDAPYSPQDNWDADADVPTWAELGQLDFIWDSDLNPIYRSAYGFYSSQCYYCMRPNAADEFNNVPVPSSGAFRVSYISMHTLNEVIERFSFVVSEDSSWLATNPIIDIRIEWTGFWGDWSISEAEPKAILDHFVELQTTTGVDVKTVVFTDSAGDCWGGRYDNAQYVENAIAATVSNFSAVYFSKRDMMNNQRELTSSCFISGGHAMQPMNHLYMQKYFNIICNGGESPSPKQANYCMEMTGQENIDNCFYSDGSWISNMYPVCQVFYLNLTNLPPNYCYASDAQKIIESAQKLPVCEAVTFSGSEETATDDKNNGDDNGSGIVFTICIVAAAALCLVYTFADVYHDLIKTSSQKVKAENVPKPKPEPLLKTEDIQDFVAENDQVSSVAPGTIELMSAQSYNSLPNNEGVDEAQKTQSDLESGRNIPDVPAVDHDHFVEDLQNIVTETDQVSSAAPGTIELMSVQSYSSLPNNEGVDEAQKTQSDLESGRNIPDVPAVDHDHFDEGQQSILNDAESNESLSRQQIYANTVENVAAVQNNSSLDLGGKDRLNSLDFARYLASIHIVLGHMYQGNY